MTKGSLDSVRLKLDRAEKHLHDAETIISGLSKAKCVVVTEEQPNGISLATLHIEASIDPALSLIVSVWSWPL